MNEPTMDSLARRLERVERQNQRLKQAGALVLVIAVAALLMGQIPLRAFDAGKFTLIDAEGKPRAVLEVGPDGSSGLGFGDRGGRLRATLGVRADGSPVLALYDANGKVLFKAP